MPGHARKETRRRARAITSAHAGGLSAKSQDPPRASRGGKVQKPDALAERQIGFQTAEHPPPANDPYGMRCRREEQGEQDGRKIGERPLNVSRPVQRQPPEAGRRGKADRHLPGAGFVR